MDRINLETRQGRRVYSSNRRSFSCGIFFALLVASCSAEEAPRAVTLHEEAAAVVEIDQRLVFPPSEGETASPGEFAELLSHARRLYEARDVGAIEGTTTPINVTSATGAPPRTEKGDYQRLLGMNYSGEDDKILEIPRESPLVVRFDHPVVTPAEVGEALVEPPEFFSISMIAEGTWVWSATDMLMFTPKTPWEPGESYLVSLSEAALNAKGDHLIEGFEWRFRSEDDRHWLAGKVIDWTPNASAPRVLGMWPRNNSGLSPGEHVVLIFDQPVSPEVLVKHLTAWRIPETPGHRPRRILASDLVFERPEAPLEHVKGFAPEHLVRVRLDPLLEPGARVRFGIDVELYTGVKAKGQRWRDFYQASPLALESVTCTVVPKSCHDYYTCSRPCGATLDPHEQVRVEYVFNNPVRREAFLKHLTVDPLPDSRDVYGYGSTDAFTVYFRPSPGARHTLSVSEGLSDIHGYALKATASTSLETRDLDMFMASGSVRHGTFERKGSTFALPLTTLNVDKLRVRTAALSDAELSRWVNHVAAHRDTSSVIDSGPEALSSIAWEVEPNTPRNQSASFELPLESHLSGAVGPHLIEVRAGAYSTHALVQITDIGLSALHSAEGIMVWVTSLSEGDPLAGVEVELRDEGKTSLRATTDERGLVRFPATALQGTGLLIARLGEDRAFTVWTASDPDVRQLFPSANSWAPPPSSGERVALWSERGVYRPGEDVFFKALIRREDTNGLTVEAGGSVTLALHDSNDELIAQANGVLDDLGGVDFKFSLPTSSAMGHYRATLEAGDPRTTVGYAGILVEAYRPPTFEVSVGGSVGEGVLRGEVSGQYLFGAPMAGAKVQWSMSRWPTSPSVVGFEGYSFSASQGNSWSPIATAEETLDDSGALSIAVDADVLTPELNGPWYISLDVEVQDIDRQSVEDSHSFVFYDRDTYLGVEYPQRILKEGEVLSSGVVAVSSDKEGAFTTRAGVEVELKLLRKEWHQTALRGPGGSFHWSGEELLIEEAKCTLRTQKTAQRCDLRPSKSGSYQLVASGSDRAGRVITSDAQFYVYGKGYVPWKPSDEVPAQATAQRDLELVVEERVYKAGDVAKVLVKSPWERSNALVTVYRAGKGVLFESVFELDGSAQIVEVPVTEAMGPNARVEIVVVRGRQEGQRGGDGRDWMAPAARYGYTGLRVEAYQHTLDVEVTLDKTNARPGDEIGVNILVTDTSGAPVKGGVSLWAVDEAVLQLTNYRAPSLGDQFYPFRYEQQTLKETRGDLLVRQLPELGRFGGDGAGDLAPPMDHEQLRQNFKTTALFLGRVDTDAKGHATATLPLPDNLTRFRVMAIAYDETRFGRGRAKIRTNKPLMVRPAIPRFATQGDRFEVGAVLLNTTDRDVQATLNVQVDGGLSLEGAATHSVQLPKGVSTEVRVFVRADQVGDAKVMLRAEVDGAEAPISDGVEASLPIRPALQSIHAARGGVAEGSLNVALRYPSGTLEERGTLELSMSMSLLSRLEGSMDYLMRYPYGCLEQTSSSTFPLVSMTGHLDTFGVSISPAKVAEMAQSGVDRLQSMQTASGGLGYWPGEASPHFFGTALGVMVWSEAREKNLRVSKRAMDRAVDYLARELSGQEAYEDDSAVSLRHGMTSRAFALLALAKAGAAQPAVAEFLNDHRAELSTTALAFLTLAVHHGGGAPSLKPALLEALRARISVKGDTVEVLSRAPGGQVMATNPDIFGSNERELAVVLQAFAECAPKDPINWVLAHKLLGAQVRGHWGSTQADLWSMQAITAFASKVEAKTDGGEFLASLDGRPLQVKSITKHTARVSLPTRQVKGATSLTLKHSSGATFFYSLQSDYSRLLEDSDRESASSQLSVYRVYEDERGAPLKEIKAGEVVRVRLYIEAPKALQYVALNDPLPAGLEPVNLRLATAGSARVAASDDDDVVFYESGLRRGDWYFHHSEQRDDRVLFFANRLPQGIYELSYLTRATTPGLFLAPPSRVEDMYHSDVWARGAMTEVSVR